MISLGGRLVNMGGSSGPLSATGSAGPQGRMKLLRISGAIAFARMVPTPVVSYLIALAFSQNHKDLPLAFWAAALVVVSMPTANNMSTMADLIGSGRSISAATTAMQLMVSPVMLTLSLALLLSGAQD